MTVSVDEDLELLPATKAAVWLASGSMEGNIDLWRVDEMRLVQSIGGRSKICRAFHGILVRNVGNQAADPSNVTKSVVKDNSKSANLAARVLLQYQT